MKPFKVSIDRDALITLDRDLDRYHFRAISDFFAFVVTHEQSRRGILAPVRKRLYKILEELVDHYFTMHVAIVSTAPGKIEETQVVTETPGPDEVLLDVDCFAILPMDSCMLDMGLGIKSYPIILGCNAAGTITKVGQNVEMFSVGDRVTTMGFGKTMQKYAVRTAVFCAKIPDSMSFADAATIPGNLVSAYHGIFNVLKMDRPPRFPVQSAPSNASIPILVYGAGSSLGQFTLQLLRATGYTNVFTTASAVHHDSLHTLGAVKSVDYRSPSLVDDIVSAAGGKVSVIIDCISTLSSLEIDSKCVKEDGKVVYFTPIKTSDNIRPGSLAEFATNPTLPFSSGVDAKSVQTMQYYLAGNTDLDGVLPYVVPQLLKSDLIKPNPVHLLDQGSLKDRVLEALKIMRTNATHGKVLIVKVD